MTEVMSVTPIILVLIILLFGSDSSVSSALPVAPQSRGRGTKAEPRCGDFSKFSEMPAFESLRKE
jgi:hypothetical protein